MVSTVYVRQATPAVCVRQTTMSVIQTHASTEGGVPTITDTTNVTVLQAIQGHSVRYIISFLKFKYFYLISVFK